MPSLDFVRRHRRFLAFGLMGAFVSSFGQTYFIGAFGDPLKEAFALSSGEFGALYSFATLGSAVVLMWSGRWIDHMPLRRYTTIVTMGLVAACAWMSLMPDIVALAGILLPAAGWLDLVPISLPAVVLGLGFFGLRHFGQGLMSHTVTTATARRFTARRGLALSVIVLGFPLGQAGLPFVAVTLTHWVGWRLTWALAAGAVAVVAVPLLRVLLRGLDDGLHPAPEALRPAVQFANVALPPVDRTRGQALRDPRFWLVLPAAIAPGLILTGVFFHQSFLVAEKGWDLAVWTGLFTLFSAAQISASLGAGPLIDRVTARGMLPFFLLPMGLGLTVFALLDGLWLAAVFLVLIGLTAGLAMTLGGALWAELYGVAHLGAIRSAVTSLGIVGTAASPVGMGMLIDRGWSAEALAWLAAGYLAMAVLGVGVGLNLPERPIQSGA